MPISTIRSNERSVSNILVYILGIIGIALVIFFAVVLVKNINKVKGTAGLTVETLYGSANVSLNGNNLGTTPVNAKDVTPGTNKITVKSDDRTYETSVNFLPKDAYTHTVALKLDLGTSDLFSSDQEFWFEKETSGSIVRIISDPADANILIDGTVIGKTPFSSDTLSEGEYQLRIEKPGYESQEVRISLKKGYTLNIKFKLFPVPTTESIKPFPDSPNLYEIRLDNNSITSDPQAWVTSIVYWNKTRGIKLEGTGVNKEPVFDYFLDYKGNLYNKDGKLVTTPDEAAGIKDAKRGAYLGRAADGQGITKEAKDALQYVMGTLIGKSALIKETGTGWLRVRNNPSLNGSEVARVNVGNTYPVTEEKTGWVKIKVSDELEGWVSADYVKLSE